jgi:hypothetical protein
MAALRINDFFRNIEAFGGEKICAPARARYCLSRLNRLSERAAMEFAGRAVKREIAGLHERENLDSAS